MQLTSKHCPFVPRKQGQGNFAPVPEISGKTPVQVVSGVVPSDFPPGVYIRNGKFTRLTKVLSQGVLMWIIKHGFVRVRDFQVSASMDAAILCHPIAIPILYVKHSLLYFYEFAGPNPQFGGKAFSSPLGVLDCHMFEGDGMLHATYFGEGGHVSYLNRYVVTETYEMEKRQGRRAALPSFDGDSQAILLAYLFNTVIACFEVFIAHKIHFSSTRVATYECSKHLCFVAKVWQAQQGDMQYPCFRARG